METSKQLTQVQNNSENDRLEKCNNWLKSLSIDDDCSSVYSDGDTSNFTEESSNSAMESGFVFENNGYEIANMIQTENDVNIDTIKYPTKHIDKISIYKSRKVHIGDVTYVYVNKRPSEDSSSSTHNISSSKGNFTVLSRRNWLAQPPIQENEYLKDPARFVIIGHSATEEGFTQSENTLLVRLIQDFHVESRKWNDIAYNFLIGSDGTVFEGRGWRVVGAHTIGYNKHSLSICFVGCFTNHKPPVLALERAKALIEHGVKIGAIQNEYSLVGQRQCRTSQSPGQKLYEEITTWDNWDSSIVPDSPHQLVCET